MAATAKRPVIIVGRSLTFALYHEQFRTAANERYFKNLNHLQNTHSAIADYFLGIWAGIPKPYQYTDLQKQRFGVVENEGLADRKVPKQPNVFRGQDSESVRYNSRKLNELPYHLLRSRRYKELFSLCAFNFEFLQAKLCSFPLPVVIGDYEDALSRIEDQVACRQLGLVMDALRLSASLLTRFPWMLAFELSGRLLPLVSENEYLQMLLLGCDLEGHLFNCFLPAHHCFHSPGGPLKYSLEEHPFAKMLASVSNQLIVWDVQTGDLTRIINPNIEGIFLGMALSKDDKYSVAYTNNNQLIIMSLITGDHRTVEPEGMENQMEIGKVLFTRERQILCWSSSQFFLFDLDGKQYHRERLEASYAKMNLIHVFFKSKRSARLILHTGEKDDWMVTMVGREENRPLEPFTFAASMAYFDTTFNEGLCCIKQTLANGFSNTKAGTSADTETNYALVTFEIVNGHVFIRRTLAENMEEKANAIIYWKKPAAKGQDVGQSWTIAVTVDGFLLCKDLMRENLTVLKLPADVRNIPIRPMHTTSAVALSCGDTIFVAGVRKNLYIFNIASAQLVRTVEAHFGRILHLRALTVNNSHLLISSSIDRSVKIWNMQNIFEKSFAVINMDQPIERIHVASGKPNMAIAQSRKYLGIWDIRSHRFVTTLVTNSYGSVVTDCVLSDCGRHCICIESDVLLFWDLKTQSVRQRLQAPQSQQIVFLNQEKMIGGLGHVLEAGLGALQGVAGSNPILIH
ncbi:Protein T05C3.2 [Aphelenchoides avenae]|nr:Protein T05C3.2 [Aphelenchus avenae]